MCTFHLSLSFPADTDTVLIAILSCSKWGYLGKHVRVVIPSCVVSHIQQEFPDPGAEYTGFLAPHFD